jgi:hypothetical protein
MTASKDYVARWLIIGWMANLYIFIDESGDFNFSPTGTAHLVLCSYSTTDPHQHTLALQKLKYSRLDAGEEQECFHATEDKQVVRDSVYAQVKTSKDALYDVVYLEKRKAHPSKQNKKEMYSLMAGALLTYIFGRVDLQEYSYEITVIIDQALTKKEQGYVKAAIKPRLKATGRPYRLYFFQTKSDPNAQIADYGAWGKFVSLERGERRPIAEMKPIVANDFNLFRTGRTNYY